MTHKQPSLHASNDTNDIKLKLLFSYEINSIMCWLTDIYIVVLGRYSQNLTNTSVQLAAYILLDRLENYVDIFGQVLAWYGSYLSSCYQFLCVTDNVSDQTQVKYGVPQGSILGHLHFSTCISTCIFFPYCGPMNASTVLYVLHMAGLFVL